MLGSGIEAFDNFVNNDFVNELSNLNNSKEFYQFFLSSEKDEQLTKSVVSDIKNKGIDGYCTIVGLYFYFKYMDVELLLSTDHVFMKYNGKYFDSYNCNGVDKIKDLYFFSSRHINPKIYKFDTSDISKKMFDIAIEMKLPAVNERLKDQIPNDIQDIWNQLQGIKYGVWDDKTKETISMKDKRLDIPGYFYENCRTLSPKEVLKNKSGTCWDVSILTCYLAQSKKLKFDAYYYECVDKKNIPVSTHMVPAVKYKNHWYLLEYSYKQIYGIYKCNTIQECWKVEDDSVEKFKLKIVYKNTNFASKLVTLFNDTNIKAQKILDITGTTFNYEES